MEVIVKNIKGQDTSKKVTLNDGVFGVEPNDHAIYLDVKQYLAAQRQGTAKSKQLARRSALSYKVKEDALIVVEDFTFDAPKTKSFIELLNNLQIADKKTLVVVAGADKNVYLSSRNLPKAKVAAAADLNTYGVLDAAVMVVTESAVAKIEEVLAK